MTAVRRERKREAATGADTTAGQAAFAKTVEPWQRRQPLTDDPEGEAQQKALETLGLTAEDAQALAAYAKTLSEAGASAGELQKTLQTSWHLWRRK